MRTMTLGMVLLMMASVPAGLAAGRKAPTIELRGSDGRQARLADFRGNVLIVDLWASWCAPCAASFPALDGLFREYRTRGLDVVAIDLDERQADADRFLAAHPHEMPVWFDPHARMLRAFEAPGIPSSFVIDRKGSIRFTHAGYDSSTLADYRREIETLLNEPSS